MTARLLTILISLFLFSCFNKNPENYFDEGKRNNLLTRICSYVEEKPKGVAYEKRFGNEFIPYYKSLRKAMNYKFKNLYLKDSVYYFMVFKDERKSLYPDFRAIGGKFKLKGDSISYFDISFITPMMREEELILKSEELFEVLHIKGNSDQFFGNLAYMEWPNPDVLYNTDTNRWYFPEGSKYKIFEQVMSGQK